MEKLLITILFLIGIFSFGQDLKCADFKNGKFITPADSIFPYQGTILRKNGKQVEWSTQSLDTTYLDIKYLDDCNYVMTYNSIKNNLENIEKYINASGGMRVEVIQIKGDTLFYNGIIKNDSIKFEQPGKLIKVE